MAEYNHSFINSFSPDELFEVWKKYRNHRDRVLFSNRNETWPFDDCWLWTGRQLHGYGLVYAGTTKCQKRKLVRLHILAAWIHHGKGPDDGQQASHLCHRRNCYNPKHVVFESVLINNQRSCCVFSTPLRNGKLRPSCSHFPLCLRKGNRSGMRHKDPDPSYKENPRYIEKSLSRPPCITRSQRPRNKDGTFMKKKTDSTLSSISRTKMRTRSTRSASIET